MGINWGVLYVTETLLAEAPSTPVTGVASTITGYEVQVVMPETLGSELISASAYWQALVVSPALVVDVEVYTAVARAAFSVEIKAYPYMPISNVPANSRSMQGASKAVSITAWPCCPCRLWSPRHN